MSFTRLIHSGFNTSLSGFKLHLKSHISGKWIDPSKFSPPSKTTSLIVVHSDVETNGSNRSPPVSVIGEDAVYSSPIKTIFRT